MARHEARRDVVRHAAVPAVAGSLVAAALALAELPWLAVVAGVAVMVCVAVCFGTVISVDRASRRAFRELQDSLGTRRAP